jgi:hypothetical protein
VANPGPFSLLSLPGHIMDLILSSCSYGIKTDKCLTSRYRGNNLAEEGLINWLIWFTKWRRWAT